ncbi:MAG: HAD-IA family hydrolase [Halioglobus sp.]
MNIVFDLDGTLIDSAQDIQSVAATVLARHGKAALTLEETRRFIGEGSAVFVRRMMAARNIEAIPERFASLHDEFLAQYEFALDKAVFYPGVIDALTAMKAAGHKLGLCTNKPHRPALAVLRHMHLDVFFDTVVAGGMLASRKPEPDMLLLAMENLGGDATLYVGDSEIDAETAIRAGVIFALYSGGYRKTPVSEMQWDWVFDHFDALPDIVSLAMAKVQA